MMKIRPVLTKNNEFHRVYSRGKYAASATLVVYYLKNGIDITRVGITTSKKIGNAVKRNRIRRLIKENMRQLFYKLPKGIDIVIVARKAEKQANVDTVGRELRYLFSRLRLLDKESQC